MWESGIALKSTGTAPIQISGIWCNNNFVSTGALFNGTGWTLDYSRGQVIFHNPLPSTTTVKLPRTERLAQVYPEDSYVYRRLTYDWLQRQDPSGAYDFYERAYLPAIFVGVNKYRSKPFELGDRAKWTTAEIEFNIFAIDDFERATLSDICYMLESKCFNFFNVNNVPFPLNISGALTTGALTWAQMSTGYFSAQARFNMDAISTKIKNNTLPVKQHRMRITLDIPVTPV